MRESQSIVPVLLMVSGGSDSTALLELVRAYAAGEGSDDGLFAMLATQLPAPDRIAPFVLHVNHMLRGADSDADERFVRGLCEGLDVPCEDRACRCRHPCALAPGEAWRPSRARSAIAWRRWRWNAPASRRVPRTGSSALRIRSTIASRPSSCVPWWERAPGACIHPARSWQAAQALARRVTRATARLAEKTASEHAR